VKVTAREVLQLLNATGFIETRIVGDHHRFTDGRGHHVTVAYTRLKDVIHPKTYQSICRQAGLK